MSQAWVWACVVAQCVAAGACLQFGLVAATSRQQQRVRTGWSAALSVVAALTMLTGSLVVLNAGSPELTMTLTDVRSLLFTAVFLLVFPAFDQTLEGPASRVAFVVVLTLVALRLALWFGTDLLRVVSLDAQGWPVYGPAGPLFALLIGIGVVSWAVVRTYQLAPQDLVVSVVASGTAIVLGVVGVLNPASAVAETMSTLWIAPMVLCLQLLRRRQGVRDVRARRRTLDQQTALVELGRHIVTDDLPAAVARAEEVARHGLGAAVDVQVVDAGGLTQPTDADVVTSGSVRAVLPDAVDPGDLPFVEGVVHLVGAVAARAEAEERSARARLHDPVSGLPNRVFALERITQARHESAITEDQLVVQMCHLEGLEDLRTLRGYEEADRVTVRVARALEAEVTSASGWWHAGGDAFVSISPWSDSTLSPVALARMRAEVARASDGSRLPTRVRLGLGVVVARDGSTVADLLREVRAVAGLAHAHGGVEIAHRDFAEQLRERVRLEQDLENAVDRDEIEVHYQPILATGSRKMHGVEALARWRRGGRLLSPGSWIPVAESSGLMGEIGAHVLRIACRDQARWGRVVAVNTSPVQLGEDRLVESVLESARQCGPENLVIEVTENALVTDAASTTARLAEMRDHGIRIALDDFGAEYSSLTRLATLPIDIVKIDRGFIEAVTAPEGRAVVAAVHAMSQALGKVTVAEGIETDAQLRAVHEIGCELVQGYLLGRPEPVPDATSTLTPSANR
ncbi:EAL domain-containing protein [Solicola sp. PLA-1-18]|uniref:EAL domain-containing protein n=1 Tax=Solicola sp. PLA-1-18 TaxID=3380532 RepID=UPI003B7FDBCC